MGHNEQFSAQDKQQYLEALNNALTTHPHYRAPMAFVNIRVDDGRLVFHVRPTDIKPNTPEHKAFEDIASILTLSGNTLPFQIRPATPDERFLRKL